MRRVGALLREPEARIHRPLRAGRQRRVTLQRAAVGAATVPLHSRKPRARAAAPRTVREARREQSVMSRVLQRGTACNTTVIPSFAKRICEVERPLARFA